MGDVLTAGAFSLLGLERRLRGIPKPDDAPVHHILMLEYRLPLGCCVHMTPAFEAIKRSRPQLKITVATRSIGAEVLRHSPFVNNVIVTPDPLTNMTAAVRELRGELRRRAIKPECVLTGASDQRTRIAMLGLLGTNAWRGGFTLKPPLYHRPLTYDGSTSLIGNNLRVAKLVGCDAVVTRPRVFFCEADVQAAAALLSESVSPSRPLIAMVTQNSGGQRTGWHTDRWVQVIQAASARGCAIVYVGAERDVAEIEAIRLAAGAIGVSLAGKTSISQLAAVLAMSDAVVTLDTGTLHVGRAVGVPMVVLGISWQRPLEWLPLEVENVRILRGTDRDDIPPNYHLDEISADWVIATLDELMASYPSRQRDREARVAESLSAIDHLGDGRSVV